MSVYTGKIILEDKGGYEVFDITKKVKDEVRKSKLANGTVTVFVPGATGALTSIEYETGVLQDLKKAIERLAPQSVTYDHDRRWGDGNGFSHVRAALLGPSISIPAAKNRLVRGTWQQIVFIDFDNRPRNRNLAVSIIGE